MARTTYGVWSANENCTELRLLGEVEASSPPSAVREYFKHIDDVPPHLAVVAIRSVHFVEAEVETQMRLKLS